MLSRVSLVHFLRPERWLARRAPTSTRAHNANNNNNNNNSMMDTHSTNSDATSTAAMTAGLSSPLLNVFRESSSSSSSTTAPPGHTSTPAERHRILKHSQVQIMPSYLELLSCDEFSTVDDRETKLDRGEKIVYFIRHGQSEANIASDEEVYMDIYRDAPLTEHGARQAQRIQEVNHRFNVQTVYTSPLTRAIQTTCHAFENSAVPVYAWPMVTEFYPHLPECTGQNTEDLLASDRLQSLKKFQDVNLDAVHDNWWEMTGDRSGRLRSFFQWLTLCPERRIAVVCHWGFIYEALQVEAAARSKLEIDNCTWVRTKWKTSALPLQQYNMPVEKSQFSLVMLPTSATSEAGTRYLADLAEVLVAMQNHAALSNFSCLQYNRLPSIVLAKFGPLDGYDALRRVKDVIQAQVQEVTPSFTKYLDWHRSHRRARKESSSGSTSPRQSPSPTHELRQHLDQHKTSDREERWKVGESAEVFLENDANVSLQLPFKDKHIDALLDCIEETVEFEGATHFERYSTAITFLQHNEDFAEGRLWQPLGNLDFALLISQINKHVSESNSFRTLLPILLRITEAQAADTSGVKSHAEQAARAAVTEEEWREYEAFLHVMQNDIHWEVALMSNRGNTHPYLYTEAVFSV